MQPIASPGGNLSFRSRSFGLRVDNAGFLHIKIVEYFFAAIEVSFARIFGVPPRGIAHQCAVAVLMILAFCALLIVSVAASVPRRI